MNTRNFPPVDQVLKRVWDHANGLAMVPSTKLKESHLHVRVIHEPGICKASATLTQEARMLITGNDKAD
jgi:hypothetical protein